MRMPEPPFCLLTNWQLRSNSKEQDAEDKSCPYLKDATKQKQVFLIETISCLIKRNVYLLFIKIGIMEIHFRTKI